MYRLIFYLTKNPLAAFIGGFIFTFSPYRMGKALGHLDTLSTEWIPFYVLSVIKLYENPTIKNKVKSAFFLFVCAITSWYYLLFSTLFTCVFYLYAGYSRKKIKIVLPGVESVLMALGILFPLFLIMIYVQEQYPFVSPHDPLLWSADIAGYLIPSTVQSIGSYFKESTAVFARSPVEGGSYIGYSVILLVVISVRKYFKKDIFLRVFVYSAIVFFVLSLGPYLNIFGRRLNVPLPFLLLHKASFVFSFSGMPIRFNGMVIFCLSIVAGYGISAIIEASKSERTKIIFLVGIFFLINVEYVSLPYTRSVLPRTGTRSAHRLKVGTYDLIPEFYKQIAVDGGDYAILDITFGGKNPEVFKQNQQLAMFYQTIHHKKLLYGSLSRYFYSLSDYSYIPGVDNLITNKPETVNSRYTQEAIQQKAKSEFTKHNIKYVIYQKRWLRPKIKCLADVYGFRNVYDDEFIRAYQVF